MKAIVIRRADPERREAEISLVRALGGGEVYRDQAGTLYAVAETMRGWPVAAEARVLDIASIPPGWLVA